MTASFRDFIVIVLTLVAWGFGVVFLYRLFVLAGVMTRYYESHIRQDER